MLALHGLPGYRFLTTRDEDERYFLKVLSHRVVAIHQVMQKNLATEVINALAKAWRG